MSLSAKRESLACIHGRYQRAGRLHKQRILDEFCATCGDPRKSARRLVPRPLAPPKARRRPGPKLIYDPVQLLPVLKVIWRDSDQLCSKLLKVALPEWLQSYERHHGPLAAEVQAKLRAISPAQIDRLLPPLRVGQPKKELSATRPGKILRHQVPTRSGPVDTSQPGTVAADTVAHCDDTTAGDYIHSFTCTDLFSGWTENRAVWNKASHAILTQVKQLQVEVPFPMRSFHSDNGSELLNRPLYEYLTARPLKVPWTHSRAYRKNDNAHCEQKNGTHGRQLLGYQRFGHPQPVALLNDLYGQQWSQCQDHFRPTFKLLRRQKKDGKTLKTYENKPQIPYQRLLDSPQIPEPTKARLQTQHAALDPYALKKSTEAKLKKFFPLLGNLDRESTKTWRSPAPGNIYP